MFRTFFHSPSTPGSRLILERSKPCHSSPTPDNLVPRFRLRLFGNSANSATALLTPFFYNLTFNTATLNRHNSSLICGKIFGNASALAKHKLTHSDERKYVCTMCGKAFKRQDHLNGHMLTHRNKKPYECRAEGCGKSYCDARSLRRHTENHHSGMQIPSSTTSSPSTPVTIIKEEESTQSCIQYAPPPTVSTTAASTATSDPIPSTPTTKTHHVSHLQQLLASEPANTTTTSTSTSGGVSSNDGLTKQQLDLIHQIMQQTQQQATSHMKPSSNPQQAPTSSSKQKHWTVQASTCLTKMPPASSKPVECNLCHRKFKNIPALNGHMRLHGGYFKKDSDSKKCEKKEVSGPPLQTASVSVRALIEEKIIQKRTNPGQANQSLTSNLNVNQVAASVSGTVAEKAAPKPIEVATNFTQQTRRQADLTSPTSLAPSQPCVDHPLLKKSPSKMIVKRASSDPGLRPPLLTERITSQLQLTLPPDTYSFEMDDGYLSPPLPDDVLEQVEQVQESMILQGVDPAQLAESIQVASLQDIAALEDYQSPPPSPQSFQHHQDVQSVLDSPLPVGLADFAYSHSQQVNSDSSIPAGQPYSTSPLPSPSFTYPTPPASQEGHSPSFTPLQSVISNGNDASPLSAAFYTSPMSSSAAVEAALNEVLPPHTFPSSPPSSPSSNSPVPSPLSLPPTSTSPLPHHILQSQMMPNSDDPLLSSSPRDFCSRKRFDFQALKLLTSGALDLGNASAQGVTGIVLDRNGELKLIQTSCFQSIKTNSINTNAPLYVNTKPKDEMSSSSDNLTSNKTATSSKSLIPLRQRMACHLLESVKEDLEDVFLSPSVPASPIRKKRPKLENPMVNNAYVSRLRTPRETSPNKERKLLYTPPPMLPPTRHGKGLYWQTVTTWPCSTTVKGVHSDEISTDLGTDTEPAIECDSTAHSNIGEDYQARIPPFNPHSYDEIKDVDVHERLLWDANLIKDPSDESRVNMFLDFACCAAIPGGGRNKEYALHVLQLCEGKVHDAMLRLMQPTPTLQADHPLLSFDYPDSERWTSNEIEAFQIAIMKFEKDFSSIAREVGSKTGKQCVQFYYIWKKICPDDYKRLRSFNELDMVSTSSESRVFACEQQDCSASFNSKAALTGHTRLHLNSTTNRCATPDKRSSSSSVTETAEEFPCKICGKIFNKVKSRSAHMKSHRPPDADIRKLKVDLMKSENNDVVAAHSTCHGRFQRTIESS
ncbi:hypothetical protein GE061_000400 [Apolygus lucorum]|uniref:Transcriptional-regulating factor 1 n=1 Tax=Apolygus lucorum TaxID=248454 RepID=A0A8S9Y459_APOLU|nr:hypothetical protein GE061_000400 [Apolygus lucorum]